MRVPQCFVFAAALLASTPAFAQFKSPSLADSFRLGTGGGVLCQVQSKSRDKAINGIFDRAWAIVCRDAARPIGKLYALRGDSTATLARLSELRKGEASCNAEGPDAIAGLGAATLRQCTLNDTPVGYRVYALRKGNILWVAEGLAGYDSALKLGLRTIVADRIVAGQVTVATTSVDDPTAFARVQAGTLDPDQALAEGYRRNNSGNYAEAAEFFDTLQQRAEGKDAGGDRLGEYLVNRALQKSNLGAFAEAETLFAEARKVPTTDRVQTRLRRNYEAIHLLNQQQYAAALVRLNQPVTPLVKSVRLPNSAIEIGAQVAAEINSGLPVGQRLGATESSALTPNERAVFLEAQALQLRGTLFRLQGQPSAARSALEKAYSDVMEVREGRVASIIRLRSQILAETALAFEDEGNLAAAEAKLRDALSLLETRYPQTASVNGARARLAAFLARHKQSDAAMALFKEVVASASANHAPTTGLGNVLNPYFALLAEGVKSNPALVDDMFLASQTLVRPGVADTQAILARELSEGSGDSARLFRQARTLDRDIERSRIDLATLLVSPKQTNITNSAIAAVRKDVQSLETEQAVTQAKLSEFPQFRAISTNTLTLSEIKAVLKPDEAFFKLTVAGRDVYAIYTSPTRSTGYRVPLSASQLEDAVGILRDTIAKDEGGQIQTFAFDVVQARKLYLDLLGPVAEQMVDVRHLIFEPDGAMLKLPLNLLIASQAGVDAYQARTARADADQFDMTGIDWLGKTKAISTAVSARSFRDARNTPASKATHQYFGFGENAPVSNLIRTASTSALSGADARDCQWPASQWNKPIAATELKFAQSSFGLGQGKIITGQDFSDTAVIAQSDLADYRILHFATHGLVTAPRPECPARPALLTSFGGAGSDGLLSFREIYDLKINADLVILSACDTAGTATVSATREAGVASGGGSALDGLVRAFIGAGGRSVLASHWPAPDDFNATERLISGLFTQASGTSVGAALQNAERGLMDDPATSHPYYWSGFAIIGDGGAALVSAK